MFLFFGCEVCGISAPWPGVKPTPPALEEAVLTLDPQGSPPLILSYEGEISCA